MATKFTAAAKNDIRNRTRADVTLHACPRWAVTRRAQARGLMFRRPGPDDCLVFPFLPAQVARLHMWFVFGPIDVVCLDGRGIVVALKERFRPWMYWSSGVPVSCAIELPVGTILRTGTRVGDRLVLPHPPSLNRR